MVNAGVLKPVDQATAWINSYVIVESDDKNGKTKFRICLDPTPLNKAVIREPYYYRTPDDIYHKLSKAKFITVVDFKKGSWQVELDEESSFLTTFNTPFGRYRFTRLPFGINVSGDAFQRKLDEVYNPLPNVIGIADDIIIWGEKADGSDHDAALQNFLEVTRKNNLKINYDKIQYKTQSVTFYGETFTTAGHKPADDKVKAIQEMPVPASVPELQRFLGMCNFLSKFTPRMAELSEPLRQLTKNNVVFQWYPEHQAAFDDLKKEITAAPTLRYYDRTKPITLQTDACRKGLGAVLLQEGQPIYFASKALQPHHDNYVAIELEALAVSWAMEKFHHYLYGHRFTLETDQKPLETILKKSLLDATAKMQRLLMKTVPYDFDVKYIKGSTNVIADCLSRAATNTDNIQLPILQVNLTTQNLRCTPDKLQQIRDMTNQDETLVLLKAVITQGWPTSIQDLPPELKPYWTFREMITVEDGLLLKGDRIIIPEKAREDIIQQIHRGHLGMQKCLNRAYQAVYWPGLYDEIKSLIANCTICLKYSPANRKDSKSIGASLGQEVPVTPWTKLASDLFTFDNQNYLLIVDYMSRFPVIRKLSSMTSQHVTEHIKAIFSEYGAPQAIVTDNGPCYSGEYFKESMQNMGIQHITTSPHYHQANGLAEGYVRIIKSLLQKAKESGDDPHAVIAIYRTTPLSDGLPSPFQLLHNRKPPSDLPQIQRRPSQEPEKLRSTDKHPEAADSNVLPVGAKVMYITPPGRTWQPAVVHEYLGYRSYKIKAENGAIYTRTRLHLKPYETNKAPKKRTPEPPLPELPRPARQRRAPERMDL